MLRRTKNQEIDGKPIIRLPPRTVERISCEFDADERAFYQSLETRTNAAMNKYIERGTAENNMMNMLILLLRLRQGVCSHICSCHNQAQASGRRQLVTTPRCFRKI